MIVFSEECSNSSLMSIISIILYGKNPAFSSFFLESRALNNLWKESYTLVQETINKRLKSLG